MSTQRPPLFAHGTVRRAMGGPAPGDLDDFFRRLERGAGLHDLGDDSVYLCEELVATQQFLGDRDRRALALLVLATFVSARQGSTRLPLGGGPRGYLGTLVKALLAAAELNDSVPKLLSAIASLARADRFDSLIGGPDSGRPLVHAHGCVYQQRLHQAEQRLVDLVRGRLDRALPADAGLEAAVDDVLARPQVVGDVPIALTGEQRDAVTTAFGRGLTVISGGPGTGKTAIVAALLRTARRLGVGADRIALAAPTGKAAQRIAAALGAALAGIPDATDDDRALAAALPEPETLHRTLGYLPSVGQFRHHENHPIAAELVIVDEASMIDLVLMEHLLRAVRPDARLVLLGDAEQLPSVDAGAVFRDLLLLAGGSSDAGAAGFARRLTISHRMDPADPDGRGILLSARAVQAGEPERALGGGVSRTVGRLADLQHRGVELYDTRGDGRRVDAFAEDWYRRRIAAAPDFERLAGREYRRTGGRFGDRDRADLAALFAVFDRCRLLTVTRRHAAGAEALNARLHQLVLRERSSLAGRPDFYPGEPVMMRQNDYRRGLFNGDQGLVVRVSDDGAEQHFRVVFPKGGDWAVFHLDALRGHIEHAMAMTVHKSQGSEFDHVALILPPKDLPLLSRELLYTGMTRARRSVTLVGAPALLRAGARRAIERFSGIAELLSSPG